MKGKRPPIWSWAPWAAFLAGCGPFPEPQAEELEREGRLLFQDVSIVREGPDLVVRSAISDVAWSSSAAMLVMLLVCLAIPWVVGREKGMTRDRWRLGTTVVFVGLLVLGCYWMGSTLLVSRTSRLSLSEGEARLHADYLWGADEVTVPLRQEDQLVLRYMRGGRGSTTQTYVIRLRVADDEHTLLYSFGEPEHEAKQTALRDVMAKVVGVRADPEVGWVYLW